jgi:hypothetical protein
MTKQKLVVIGLGAVAGLTGLVTCEVKKRQRLNRLEDAVSGLVFTQESMLEYQAKKNEDFEDRLDDLVDEVGFVYEHMEELSSLGAESTKKNE